MSIYKLSTLLFLIVVGASSCSPSLSPFSQRMYDDFQWSEQDLKSIQFYLSHDVVLTRAEGNGNSNIKDGKIRVENDRNIDRIVIKKGTPGVVLDLPNENRIAVSFDDDDRYLMFGPNKKKGGKYVLLAKKWDKRYGKVTYGDVVYNTTSQSAYASLMVDIKKAKKMNYRSENAEGRKVN